MSDGSPQEKPVAPTVEGTKKEEHKRPYIKDQDIKPILNNNRYDDEEIIPSKKGFYKDPKIHPVTSEVVNMFPWNELSPNLVANELQLALNHTKTEITEENHGKLYEAVGNVWRKVEKKKKSLTNPYAFIYKCFKTTLKGFFEEVKIENGVKVTHEHHHYHHKEKQKSFASMLMNSESDKTLDEIMFGKEKEEKRERKILDADDVKIVSKAKKSIRTELLPDWFDKGDYWTEYEAKQQAKAEQEPEMSLEELLMRTDTTLKSPESSVQSR